VVLVALLLGGVFLQARLIYPLIFLPASFEAERVAEVNLPARMIRVLRSEGDPRLTVKTPLDDSRADACDRENLDRHLFPGAAGHAYFLLVARAGEEEGALLDLGTEGLILTDAEGRTIPPVDLHAVLAGRSGGIPSYLHLALRNLVPEPGALLLDPGETRRVLLAYPREADLAAIRSARLGDRTFEPAEVRKDDLDRELAPDRPPPPVEDPLRPGAR
jgi:hypothetical protein